MGPTDTAMDMFAGSLRHAMSHKSLSHLHRFLLRRPTSLGGAGRRGDRVCSVIPQSRIQEGVAAPITARMHRVP